MWGSPGSHVMFNPLKQLSHVQSIETSELKWIDFNESTLVYDLAGYHSKKIPQCQKLPNPFFAKSIAFVSGQL